MADFFFYFGLLILVETGMLKRAMSCFRQMCARKKVGGHKEIDDDVKAEQERVFELVKDNQVRDDALVALGLKKRFGNFSAVNDLSFGVHHGECFGLLGINGAGKTTTFRMLTGDETLTSGEAFLFGHSLGGEKKEFLQEIGYCPQFDSIIEVLTGREMLRLFARLRGIPDERVESEVKRWLAFLGITMYADKQCGTYSGGNKRKLNVAMSLVGDPQVTLVSRSENFRRLDNFRKFSEKD